MGFLKKTAIVLLVLSLLLAGAAAAVFFFFDVDQFRPMAERKLSAALKAPVRIEKISLGWQNGVALRLKGLAVLDPKLKGAVLSLAEARTVVRLSPLFRKEVEASQIILIAPKAEVRKTSAGKFIVRGLEALGAAAGSGKSGASSPLSAAGLAIRSVRIENGVFLFTDDTHEKPLTLVVKDIDVVAKNVSLLRPFDVAARAAVFTEKQNVAFSAHVRLTPSAEIESARVQVALGSLNWKEISKQIPDLGRFLRQAPSGDVELRVEKMAATFALRNGRLDPVQTAFPVEKISTDAVLKGNVVTLKALTAEMAGGTLSAQGAYENLPSARWQTRFELKDLSLERALPAVAGRPRIAGKAALSARAASSGKGDAMMAALSGEGRLTVREAAALDVNLLRELFKALEVVPGVGETLRNRLPVETQQKLARPYTPFAPIDVPFVLKNGAVLFDNAILATDDLTVWSRGQIGLNGSLAGQALLRVSAPLTNVFWQSVPQLKYVVNAQGELELPAILSGTVSRPRVVPDMEYVGARVAAIKGQEIIGELLEKQLGKKNPAAETPVAAESQEDPYGKLLKDLFD